MVLFKLHHVILTKIKVSNFLGGGGASAPIAPPGSTTAGIILQFHIQFASYILIESVLIYNVDAVNVVNVWRQLDTARVYNHAPCCYKHFLM